MTGRTGKWLGAACAAATVVLVAAGCSSGGGTSTTSATAASLPKYGPAEKTVLNVGVVPAMDSAGFFVAMNEGYFAKEGLTIKYTPETSSDTAISTQLSGGLDISAGNYVSYVDAVAQNGDPLEIVGEGSIMTPGAQVIYTPANSPIKSLSQLKGKTVAVNAPDNIDFLLDDIVLSGYDIKVNSGTSYNSGDVNFPASPIAFPGMAAAVEAKNSPYVAATLPEPFASIAEQQGMVPLVDLDQGAALQFPIEGYVVTKQWAEKYPNTLDRFLAALEEGQETADTNRTAVEQAFENIKATPGSNLPAAAFGQVPASIAAVMALNTYPIGIDATRIQRVADVMYQFGLLSKPFNVSSMIMPSSQFNFAPFEGGTTS
jgi:NitT/TauT family transport system substrate-binding protein